MKACIHLCRLFCYGNMRRITWILVLITLLSCESAIERRDRFFELGNRALANGNYANAIQLFDQSLKEDANYPMALNNRGVAQMELDHPYEAILDYNRCLSIESENLDALFNRAFAYEKIGQFDNALEDIAMIEEMKPDSAFVHFYKGLVLTKARAYAEAYASFQKSDYLEPYNPETLINMATIHYFQKEQPLASKKVAEALELEPQNANAFNLLSLIALEESNYLQALVEVNRALDEVPGEPYFLNNRGYVYLQMDSLELAIMDINRSIVLKPDNGWAYRNKGIYQLKTGNPALARNLFERALRTGDFIDEIYYYIGFAYMMENNLEDACTQWNEGVKMGEMKSAEMRAQKCR